jgi:hypothetical protein
MMPGRSAFGSAPWTRAAYSNESTQSLFQALLRDRDAQRVYLIEATPFDPVGDQEVTLKYADSEVFFENADGHYKVRAHNAVNYRNEIDVTSVSVAGSAVSIGRIRLALNDDDDDSILQYYWDCRPYSIFMGKKEWDRSEFGVVQAGTIHDIEWGEGSDNDYFTILAEDASLTLQQSLQENRYLGTGLIEGTESMEGVRKPLAFGECKNVTPVRISQDPIVYQWHDPVGLSEALDFAYDGGFQLTKSSAGPGGDGEVPDVFAHSFSADDSANGRYVFDLANSVIRLSAEPVKLLTLDVKGDATVADGGYVTSAADIAFRMAQLQNVDEALFDGGSRAMVNRFGGAPVNYYSPAGNQIEMLTAMNQVMDSVWGTVTGSRTGLYRFTRVQFDDLPSSRNIRTGDLESIQRIKPPTPAKTLQLRYNRSWTVQPPDTLNLDVPENSPEHAEFVGEELRSLTPEADAATTDDRLHSKDFIIDTLFLNAADAQSEQTRRFNILKGLRHYYIIVVSGHIHQIEPGQTVSVEYDRWNLEASQKAYVRSVIDDSNTQKTRLEVWI